MLKKNKISKGFETFVKPTLIASLILATMRVKSLEYMVRHKASLAVPASPAERSDTRVSAPAATDLRNVKVFEQCEMF